MVQATFEGGLLLNEICERGYYELRHGMSDDMIESAVQAYADFTADFPDPEPETVCAVLPNEIVIEPDGTNKQLDDLDRTQDTQPSWHKYRTNVKGVGKPDGYTNRELQVASLREIHDITIKDDPKEYFHFTPRWLPAVRRAHQQFSWGAVPQELADLDNAFTPIHRQAAAIITNVAALIEEVHPDISKFFDRKSLSGSPVRLLFYHPSGQDEDMLGAGHYDKSSLTVQIAESHQGLRVARDNTSDLELLERHPDTAVLFPGTSLRENFGEDTPFQPGWHDIIRTNAANPGRTIPKNASDVCARWAMIFFANGSGFKNPDKSAMHRR